MTQPAEPLKVTFEIPNTDDHEIRVLSIITQAMQMLYRSDVPMAPDEPQRTRRRIARYFFERFSR